MRGSVNSATARDVLSVDPSSMTMISRCEYDWVITELIDSRIHCAALKAGMITETSGASIVTSRDGMRQQARQLKDRIVELPETRLFALAL